MNNNIFEMSPATPDNTKEKSYNQYRDLGGIINEKDYKNTIIKAENTTVIDRTRLMQAESIAKFAGIELHNTENAIDQRIILYGILRDDIQPVETETHPNQMSDQHLFAEALRMLGDIESLNKMIDVYKNISLGDHVEHHEEYSKAA